MWTIFEINTNSKEDQIERQTDEQEKINLLIRRRKKENYVLWLSWGKYLHKKSSIVTGKLNLWLQWSLSLGFTPAPSWTERSLTLSGFPQSTAVHKPNTAWADLCHQEKVALVSAYVYFTTVGSQWDLGHASVLESRGLRWSRKD